MRYKLMQAIIIMSLLKKTGEGYNGQSLDT